MALTYREITGLWSARVPDGPDSDAHPDTVLLEGHVTFEPEYRVPLVYPGEHIVVEPMHAVIHEGVLYGETVVGDDVVRAPLFLPVTVDDAANQTWSWVAKFRGMRLGEYGAETTLPSLRFQVPAGDDALDLSAVIPASQSGGTITVRGPQGVGIVSIEASNGQLTVTLTDGTAHLVPIPEAVKGDSITAITPSEDGITIAWDGGAPVVVPIPGWEPPSGGGVGQVLARSADDVVWADQPTVATIAGAGIAGRAVMAAGTASEGRSALDLGDGATASTGTPAMLSEAASGPGAVWPAETIARYVGQAQRRRMTIADKVHNGFAYKVARIHVDGNPTPDVLRKHVDAPAGSGSAFKPRQFFINEEIGSVGATWMANAGGWNISDNVGEMRGAQIVDGVVRHEMSTSHWQESDAIGMLPSGRLRGYSAFRGDSTQDMVNDGVLWSVAFGPILIRDGVKLDLSSSFWTSRATAKSSMHVLGQRADGDIVVLTGPGVTNVSGTTFADAANIAAHEGCTLAMHLDQGGSTQVWTPGVPIMPSSDTGGETATTSEPGRRKIPDAIYTTVPVVSPRVPRGVPVQYATGFKENNGDPARVYTDGVQTWLSGQARPVSGSITGPSGVLVGSIPAWLAPDREIIGVGNGSGSRLCKVVVEKSGNIMVYAGTETLPYVVLDSIRSGRFFPDSV